MSSVSQNVGVAHTRTQHKRVTDHPQEATQGGSIGLSVCCKKDKKSKNKILFTGRDVVQMDVSLKVATCCIEFAVSRGQSWAPPPLKKVLFVLEGCIFIFVDVTIEI